MNERKKLGSVLHDYIKGKRAAGKERFSLITMLEVTYRCNLACRGCGRISEYSGEKGYMKVKEALDADKESGAPIVYVSGGEPLLHPEIDRIIYGLTKRERFVFLCTNGLLLPDRLDHFSPHPNFYIVPHVDGLEASHDKSTDHLGVFNEVRWITKKAKDRDFRVSPMVTIYKGIKPDEITELFSYLQECGVDGIFVQPGFKFEDNPNKDLFLSRKEFRDKFGSFLLDAANKFRIFNSKTYLEHIAGEYPMKCLPWGTVVRNVHGWKSPCYGITDTHYKTLEELMEKTDWEHYRSGRDPRCHNCMTYFGFEPAVFSEMSTISDVLNQVWWTFR